MNEIHANYEQFTREIFPHLNHSQIKVLENPELIRYFNFSVNHPQGYTDNFSNGSINAAYRIKEKLTEPELELIQEIARISISDYTLENKNPNAKKEIFLGANQLFQIKQMTNRWNEEDKQDLERLITLHDKNTNKINVWEAQKYENHSMNHVAELNFNLIFGMISSVVVGATLMGATALVIPEAREYVPMLLKNYSLPMMAFTGLTYMLDQGILLTLQNIGASPNETTKLITNRHYKFLRHPLYGARMLEAALSNLIIPNPVGVYNALKAQYHGAKACELQDKKLILSYGEDAKKYIENTPRWIPLGKFGKRLEDRAINYGRKINAKLIEKFPKLRLNRTIDTVELHEGSPIAYIATTPEELAEIRKERREKLKELNPFYLIKKAIRLYKELEIGKNSIENNPATYAVKKEII